MQIVSSQSTSRLRRNSSTHQSSEGDEKKASPAQEALGEGGNEADLKKKTDNTQTF
jgi:hypothetical protein